MWDNGTTDIVVSEDYCTLEPYAIGIEIGNSELRYVANSVLSELYDLDPPGKEHGHIFTVLSSNFPRKRFTFLLKCCTDCNGLQEVKKSLDRCKRQKAKGERQKAKGQ